MLNKLSQAIRRYDMLKPDDHVICAVSGGADSVALLFAMYLLKDNLKITLSAAHFNHGLRGDESDRDEAFVQQLCDRLEIPLFAGSGTVVQGKKGLEAAAREARYAFLKGLPGKIATAHTADDNLETVLMHFIRGTGLKGLGGITPVSGSLLRPMLDVTRQEVLSFLKEYNLSYVTDSTNEQDIYLRNRLRHKVIPLLKEENPRLAVMTTDLAQRLRQDEAVLQELVKDADPASVCSLRNLPAALRSRAITEFLQRNGVEEPESAHIRGIDRIVHSDKPSARISLRNGVTVSRCYDRLTVIQINELSTRELLCPGEVTIPECNATVRCQKATEPVKNKDCFTVTPVGKMYIRHRIPGDSMRLSGGTKELKKLFIDRKIPAHKRLQIPVLADDLGVIGVYGIGANLDRIGMSNSAVTIYFENHEKKEEDEK